MLMLKDWINVFTSCAKCCKCVGWHVTAALIKISGGCRDWEQEGGV